jgi:hypothetical protein
MFEIEEITMRFKFVIPALAVLATTTMAAPASAQYASVYGPGYYGQSYYGPGYRTRVFRGAYAAAPAPFYNDGWVPEPLYDHSRTGGIDPNVRPPS